MVSPKRWLRPPAATRRHRNRSHRPPPLPLRSTPPRVPCCKVTAGSCLSVSALCGLQVPATSHGTALCISTVGRPRPAAAFPVRSHAGATEAAWFVREYVREALVCKANGDSSVLYLLLDALHRGAEPHLQGACGGRGPAAGDR